MPDSGRIPETLGEVGWRLNSLERQMKDGFTEIRNDVRSLQFVSKEIYERDMHDLNVRIDELVGDKKWKSQQVFTMVLSGLIAPTLMLLLGLLILRPG